MPPSSSQHYRTKPGDTEGLRKEAWGQRSSATPRAVSRRPGLSSAGPRAGGDYASVPECSGKTRPGERFLVTASAGCPGLWTWVGAR